MRTMKTAAGVLLTTVVVLLWVGLARAGEIHNAATTGDVARVKTLLAGNPDLVNAKDKDDKTPLHSAAICRQKEAIKVLLANKADVNAKDDIGWTPLHSAAFNGDKEMVKVLLANKADVNAKDNTGKTPLDLALFRKHKDVAEVLRARGAK